MVDDPSKHEDHHDHDRMLALFERLLMVAEKRIGLHFPRIVELLHDMHERDQKRQKLMDGLWVAVIGLVLGAASVILVLGLRSWIVGGTLG